MLPRCEPFCLAVRPSRSKVSFLLLQNEALYDICQNTLKIKQPEYEHLNGLIAKVMSGFTSICLS